MTKPNAPDQFPQYAVEFIPGDQVTLMCPRCRATDGYLHHHGVTVYSREEDAPTTITTVNGGLVGETQPSPQRRRHPFHLRAVSGGY